MQGYASTQIFRAEELALFDKATQLVRQIPDHFGHGSSATLRCHELARAMAYMLDIPFSDGKYGPVEHSWCWTEKDRPGDNPGSILEVYAVGTLPMVQLIHYSSFNIHHFRDLYRTYSFARNDLDEAVVVDLLLLWGFEPPTDWKPL